MNTLAAEKSCETCKMFILHRVDEGCPTGRCDLEGHGYTTTIKNASTEKCNQWK